MTSFDGGREGTEAGNVIKPDALRPGDTITFVTPASSVEREPMELACTRLEETGFRVQVPDDLYRRRGYLAGTDEVRARELMAAFCDPRVKAILPGRGGYGITRILDQLDYAAIRANPKILIGYSDLTALHIAIQNKAGLITFHGPMAAGGLGSENNLTPFSAEYFWRAILRSAYLDDAGKPTPLGYHIDVPQSVAQLRTLRPGVARGRLTGGNLALIVAVMGTEYEIDTKGRILFIEDIDERPYRIDRCLSQLKLADKLNGVAGVILGQFTGCDPLEGKPSLTLDEVFDDYFGGLDVPVIANFPAGHVDDNATLPMGGLVELDAHRGRLTLLENPVNID